MSVELEWELYDIFDSGTFAFPIYDHNSARRIVRYLLMRGILHEEIAEAIEDSSSDLIMWLNRHGKHKIGEWVIAWVNDCREEFDRGELHKMDDGDSAFDRDFFLREDSPDSDPGDDDEGGHDQCPRREEDRRSDSRITDLDSVSSQAGTSSTSATAELDATYHTSGETKLALLMATPSASFSTQASSSRSTSRKRHRPNDLDLSKSDLAVVDYEAPDSGHFSDLYTAIPSTADKVLDNALQHLNNNNNNNKQLRCEFHNNSSSGNSSAGDSVSCTCSVAHYSYRGNGTSTGGIEEVLPTQDKLLFQDSQTYCDIYFSESVTRAMDYNTDTLDRDGPGSIFIMTDSIANCLPWSSVHRYKIASSRKPDRCLQEFRSRNIEIDLIWQVKVKNHLKALREIQDTLQKYNLHSNWFKCSLSLIMDTVCRITKRYK